MKNLIVVLASIAAFTCTAEMKVGVVDMLKLVKNHPNYASNKALLESTDKDYQKKLEAIKSEGEALQTEGKKLAEQLSNPMLVSKAKSDVEKQVMEIQKKLVGIEQRYRSEALRSRQELQDLEGRLLKATGEDLRKRIGKFAQAGKYDMVFDRSAVPYSKEAYDCTNAILKEMGVDPMKARKADEGK